MQPRAMQQSKGMRSGLAALMCLWAPLQIAQAQTARSAATDFRDGAVYIGYDSGATPASAATVVKRVAGTDAWSAPLNGATAVFAVAPIPDGHALYAAGSNADGTGFLVRL